MPLPSLSWLALAVAFAVAFGGGVVAGVGLRRRATCELAPKGSRCVADDLCDVYYRVDAEGRIVFISDSVRSLLGYDPSEMVGRPIADFHVDPQDRGGHASRIENAGGRPTRVDVRMRRRDGRVIWAAAHSCAVLDERGGFAGIHGLLRDVTGDHQIRALLIRAKERAERAEAAKFRLLAAASHDIRQPMQSLRLLTAALGDCNLDARARRIVEHMSRSLDGAGQLLNSLLDMAKLESGGVKPQVVWFPLGDRLAALYDEFLPQFQQKGITLRLVPTSAMVRSDPVLLGNILRNLLTNAMRHTQEGGVLLGVRHRGRTIEVQVVDTGCGFPQDQLPRIFDEFEQVGEARELGLGLGLAIVERTARLLGHEVKVRSEVGRGSTFSVLVPRAP